MNERNKITRGNASQFFIAGELCRRGYSAVVTLGNTPNTDILCSNIEGTRFVHIQVKTFVPGNRTCSVGLKAQEDYGENFFWVLGGIPLPSHGGEHQYFIIPAKDMALNVKNGHQKWLDTPGRKGRPHKETSIRSIPIPPYQGGYDWDISQYKNDWSRIEEKLQ